VGANNLTLLSRFPSIEGLMDAADIKRLERLFQEACAKAGVDPAGPEAEEIGMQLLADHAAHVGLSGKEEDRTGD
jgi:hypothetical protein